MFHQPDIEIEDAVSALRKRGLDVFMTPEGLLIHDRGAPAYGITLVRSEEVQKVSAGLGEGTPHAALLKQCGARFEIGMLDVEKSLQDQSILTDISSALQELTEGFVYQTWDKQLIAPR